MYEEYSSSQLIFKILETSNYINLYRKKEVDRIKLKWKFNAIYFSLITLGAVFIFSKDLISNYNPPINIKLVFLGGSVFMVVISLWVIARKRKCLEYNNLTELTRKELEKTFYDLLKSEEAMLDFGARTFASNFSNIATLLFMIGSIVFESYIKHKPLFGDNLENERLYTFVLIAINMFSFVVGWILANPMSTPAYERQKGLLTNKLIFSYLIHLDNSKLNPRNK